MIRIGQKVNLLIQDGLVTYVHAALQQGGADSDGRVQSFPHFVRKRNENEKDLPRMMLVLGALRSGVNFRRQRDTFVEMCRLGHLSVDGAAVRNTFVHTFEGYSEGLLVA